MRPSAGLILLPLMLSACATPMIGPKPTIVEPAMADVATPSSWVEPAADGMPSVDWVADFGSAELSQIVSEALQRNPTIGRALAQFDASAARTRISRAALYPTLGGSGNVTRSEGGTGFLAGSTNYDLGLSAQWEVDFFGRVRTQIDADKQSAMASASDLAAARLSITGQVTQTYFNLIEARLLTDLSEREVETLERALRLTQRRFEGGVTGSSDVRLARSSLANAKALQILRLQNRDALKRSLETLMRRYPGSELSVTTDLPMLPEFTGAANPQYVLSRRPDIIAAERRMAEAGFNVDLAKEALYPTISISGSASEQALSLGDVFDLKDLAFRLGGSLTAPIFQGGRLRANIDVQRSLLQAQLENYASTVLSAYQEVENALDAEQRLVEREAELRISLEEAEKAEERLELRYTEGLATILQLLDAQSRRLSAEGQLIGSRKERLANRVRLHVALGGGEYGSVPPLPETKQFGGILGKVF